MTVSPTEQEKGKYHRNRMTNTPIRQTVQVKVTSRRYKTFDYTTVTDRLRMVIRNDNSHPTLGLRAQTSDFPQQFAMKRASI